MRTLLHAFILLITSSVIAQINDGNSLSVKITSILEHTKSIEDLMYNHKAIQGQLQDVASWTKEESISLNDYHELQSAYNSYAKEMNEAAAALGEQLTSINTHRGLKEFRMKRLLKQFEDLNSEQLQRAHQIYTSRFATSYSHAAENAQSKSGIIPAILMVFKIGETIYHSVRDLFRTENLSKKASEELVAFGMNLAVQRLQKKLQYPAWETIVPPFTTSSNSTSFLGQRSPTYTPAGLYTNGTNNRSVGLRFFDTHTPIPVLSASKKIVVGEKSQTDIPIFSTTIPLKSGDRFWVELKGNEHASFFYFDAELNSWQDPFGKSIVVGSANGQNEGIRLLPAENQFFEIVGDTPFEQFLILISMDPISEKQRQLIMHSSAQGNELFQYLKEHGIHLDSQQGEESMNAMANIEIPNDLTGGTIVPIYIQIEKTKNERL